MSKIDKAWEGWLRFKKKYILKMSEWSKERLFVEGYEADYGVQSRRLLELTLKERKLAIDVTLMPLNNKHERVDYEKECKNLNMIRTEIESILKNLEG